MTYKRMMLPEDFPDQKEMEEFEPTKESFHEVFEDLCVVISTDLVKAKHCGAILEAAEQAGIAWQFYLNFDSIPSEIRKEQWFKFVEKYNFFPNDDISDIWMNIRLTTLDNAGLDP